VSGFINHVGYLANFMQDIYDTKANNSDFPLSVFEKAIISVSGYHDSEVHNEVQYNGIEVISNLTLYIRLSEYDVKAAPKLSQGEKTLALRKIARVKEFLLHATEGNQWSHIKQNYLKQDYIDELRMISIAVGAAGKVSIFDAETAKENALQLKEILSSLSSLDLPYGMKSVLIEHLNSLIEIFETFEIFGPKDAERRIKEIIVDMGLYKDEFSPEVKTALTPLIVFCGNAMGKFKNGVDFVQAGQYVLKLFGVDVGSSE